MYAQSVVQERLAMAAASLGWTPTPHSIDEVDRFTTHLQQWERPDADGRIAFSRDLTQSEFRFITNERILSMCDASYFLTRYARLGDENNTTTRFRFRDTQRIYYAVISDLESTHSSIELFIGKARQQFVTTLTELLIAHRVIFYHDVNCVVASADRTKSEEMARKVFFCYDRLPWWLRPKYSRRIESVPGLLEFDTTNSRLSVQHGSGQARQKGQQRAGIARGTTLTVYHLCLSPHTLIRTSDSRVLPMGEIKAGMSVVGLDGSLVRVRKFWTSPRKNEVTSEISVWGTPTKLSCTRDHRVLTERGWRKAASVKSGDWLVYPIRKIHEPVSPVLTPWYEKHKHRSSGHTEIDPTFEFGRIVGLYLAEGSIIKAHRKTPTGVMFTLHEREVTTVQSWLTEVFDERQFSKRRQNSKTAIVSISERGFATWLMDHFGAKDEKRIPDVVWSYGREFCRGLVYGYLFGDGHYSPRDSGIYATSIRVALPIGIRELLASLGHGWAQIAYREGGLWYNRNCAPAWILTIVGTTANSLRKDFGMGGEKKPKRVHDEHWKWIKGDRIAVEVESNGDGHSSEFFDLEVYGNDHAFLTACGIVHNSEAGHIPNPEEQIEAAIFKAVHPSPKVFGVIESSFSSDRGWFAENYKYARDSKIARHKALFFSWPCARELYPTPTDAKMFPVPYNWSPSGKVREQILKAELFIQNHPLLSPHFGSDWTMPIEQQYYYHRKWTHAFETGGLSTLLQEVPCDDQEAMVASYDNVFGREVIEVCHQERTRDFDAYAIVGQSIEARFDPPTDDIDYDQPRIPIVHKSPRGETYQWELIPLRYDMSTATGSRGELDFADGKLFVYRHPPRPPDRTRVEYGIGVDSATGMGHDFSAISVTQKGSGSIPDFQVAEFRSRYVGHVEIFAFTMPIALYFRDRNRDIMGYPVVGIEQIASVGDVCQKEMKRLGYPGGRFFNFGLYYTKKLKQPTNKQGWYTNTWSRPMLIGNFVHVVRNGWYVVNSPWTIENMREFEIHQTATRQRMEHSSESEDDDIFASAISTFILHDMDTLADRGKRQFRGKDEDPPPPVDLAPSGITIPTRHPKPLTLDDVVRGRVGLDRYMY